MAHTQHRISASQHQVSATNDLRRLKTVAAIGLVLEAALFSAMVPLLAHFTHQLHLSKAGAGILTAIYAAGMLPGSVAGGWLTGRIGARTVTVIGFGLLGLASVVVGLADSIVTLDGARAVQGFGAGCVWTGLLTCLIAADPEGGRGQLIGTAVGAATFGTLFGPALGTVAAGVGPLAVFATVGAGSVVMSVWVMTIPPPPHLGHGPQIPLMLALRRPSLLTPAALALIPGLVFGILNALIPLRIAASGAGAVGAIFLASAVVSCVLNPIFGRISDRRGRLPVLRRGLAMMMPALVLIAIVRPVWLVAVTVISAGAILALYTAPALALLTEAAERLQVAPGSASSLVNLTFCTGEMLGASLGALTAQATSEYLPFLLLAGFCAIALLSTTSHATWHAETGHANVG